MLEVRDLSVGYGVHAVVHGATFTVRQGEAVAIIGSNGAGKSTLLRAVCGLLRATAGSVRFDGTEVLGRAGYELARLGVAYVPAERHLFPDMSVSENLALGAYPRPPDPGQERLVFRLFPALEDRRRQRVGTMSGGEQQMVAIGRALMASPRLLVLDEPTTGLAPVLAAQTYDVLAALRREGMTILVAEQQVPLALELTDRGYVLEEGRFQLEGTAEDLEDNPEVRRAYLGIA
ncbi:MAG: ABC transporter ATP-binding protein [Nitriliruptorales bacterium]